MQPGAADFDALLEEGASVPLEGWDFSWFEGRASEDRPSWHYAERAAERAASSESVLDLETGGGEVFAFVLDSAGRRPHVSAATEAFRPNVPVARSNLAPRGALVVAADSGALPFPRAAFALVLSRHPVATAWDEVARVLRNGGTFLAQMVGPGSNRELTDFMMGVQPVGTSRSPSTAAREAAAAGLEVLELREEALRTVFYDVAAVVHFLRKVCWTVPGFTVAEYRPRLRELHRRIEREGSFVSHSTRFLLEARRLPRG